MLRSLSSFTECCLKFAIEFNLNSQLVICLMQIFYLFFYYYIRNSFDYQYIDKINFEYHLSIERSCLNIKFTNFVANAIF